ncbi:protein SPEC3-like [Dendronephthya gigantea]|uniref:protein SPEC3-like n=1 Tax=Dendronephthya gigantea TaxID=151771 RepID=UPI001069FE65|nr:protein SPEC3-like [Dendronephthya gigantea]
MAQARRSMTDDMESDVTTGTKKELALAKQRQNLVAIPIIPRPLAIFCLVANIIVPGTGTIISGFLVFCFHHKKDNCLKMINMCLGNVLVGLAQLITVVFLLIGWFWSIIWGCALVGHSQNYQKDSIKPVILRVQSADDRS